MVIYDLLVEDNHYKYLCKCGSKLEKILVPIHICHERTLGMSVIQYVHSRLGEQDLAYDDNVTYFHLSVLSTMHVYNDCSNDFKRILSCCA